MDKNMDKNMDRKEALTRLFFDTEIWYRSTEKLRRAVKNTRKGSILYRKEEMVYIPEGAQKRAGKIEVSMESPMEAVFRLLGEKEGLRITLLNSASATTPGGAVRRGGNGPEEDLCRCSTLYPDLAVEEYRKAYYERNQKDSSFVYSDACIYSPDVLLIKSAASLPERLPEQKWGKIDVITSSAPNLRIMEEKGIALPTEEKLLELHTYRAMKIMAVAAAHGCACLVVGSHGCSGYHNPPAVVAKAWKAAVSELASSFEGICFAMGGTGKAGENYEAFQLLLS